LGLTRSIGGAVVRIRAVRQRAGEKSLRFLGQAALAAWFFDLAAIRIGMFDKLPFGMDIRIYYRGVQNWLNGGDPWAANAVVGHHTYSYAGTPATTVVLGPSALFSEDQFVILWLVISFLSAVALIRMLRLPLYWLMFPPIVEALISGNPQIVVVMLLVAGARRAGVVAESVAVALKVYAYIAVLGEREWRRLILAAGVSAATILVAPAIWINYAQHFGMISGRLAQEAEGGYSAFYYPVVLIPTAVAIAFLWRIDPKAAVWLAVPALWPASEFHYAMFALPFMTPFLAVLLAIPLRLLAPITIVFYVIGRYAAAPARARFGIWATDWSAARA